MKNKLLIAAALLALAGSGFAADEHGHEPKPLHGGVVAEAAHLELELVARADVIALLVRDHGKPVGLQGASARLTLLSGTEKSELQLAPAGERLEARGAFELAPGSKAVATVMLPGKKAIQVRFALK
ncbi:hypothetical protein [Roseateles toxinivorans]|uniref:Copper(I)-binding protein n=1 Tax=Roseateles toxinivorans TaxID=270368 RepID=A0A4R6QFZ9_9BURK|nr:hypothetical protein [Roseateles toxinivorans]TDP61323.1 hypothetical protein DES47_1136 [Roseateles toxinivorans]